jgi:CheY-like chemotaxis protein
MAVLDGAADVVYLMRGAVVPGGWDVQVFPDDRALAEVARSVRPDVALVDIGLGREAESWDMLRALKENPATATIPVIVTSSNHFELQDHDDLLTQYAAAVLVRPCTQEDIQRSLRAALNAETSRT